MRRALMIAGGATLAVAGILACSDYGAASSDGPPDADAAQATDANLSEDAVAPGDGGDAGGPCDRAAPFGAPVLVQGTVNSPADETYAALSSDELILYFARTNGSNRDLYFASRSTTADVFGTVQPLASLNSPVLDDGLNISGDGLMAVFHSNRPDGGQPNLFFATRPSLFVDFTPPQPIDSLNTSGNEGDAYLLPNKTALYFASDRSGAFRIHRSELSTGTGAVTFSSPQVRDELAVGPVINGAPVLAPDELEIFFATTAVSPELRVFHATRATPAQPFRNVAEATELNALAVETLPSWLSADGCRLFMVSNRLGTRDIFVARREK